MLNTPGKVEYWCYCVYIYIPQPNTRWFWKYNLGLLDKMGYWVTGVTIAIMMHLGLSLEIYFMATFYLCNVKDR